MDTLRDRGERLVKLDGVGGALILIRASLHREGVVFPTFAFAHQIETEGLARHIPRLPRILLSSGPSSSRPQRVRALGPRGAAVTFEGNAV